MLTCTAPLPCAAAVDFLNIQGKAVIADENGQALLDGNGQPIAVPVAEDGAVDLTLLPMEQRDVVQEKGHTLEDSEPFPADVKADLDALDMERVKQMKSLNGFIQWCRDRVANKKANDNEFLDELEEVRVQCCSSCIRAFIQSSYYHLLHACMHLGNNGLPVL